MIKMIEYKDHITLAISIVALVLSIISFLRTRNSDRIAKRQSFIEKKYEFLSQAEKQHLRIDRCLAKIKTVKDGPLKEKLQGTKKTLEELFGSMEELLNDASNFDFTNASTKETLALEELLGLVKERNALLDNTEALILRELGKRNNI